MKRIALFLVLSLACALGLWAGAGDGLDPAKLLQPPTDSWPTYNGDYSGRRFSPLTKINDANVKSLSLAWVYSINRASDPFGGVLKATPLVVNGIMYFTHGPGDLELHLDVEGRNSFRQSWRGHLRELALFRDSGLPPCFAQH